jgi:hypothetical protein
MTKEQLETELGATLSENGRLKEEIAALYGIFDAVAGVPDLAYAVGYISGIHPSTEGGNAPLLKLHAERLRKLAAPARGDGTGDGEPCNCSHPDGAHSPTGPEGALARCERPGCDCQAFRPAEPAAVTA